MPLLDSVRLVVNRLALRGWAQLLARHGLHLEAPDLAAELRRPLVDGHGKSTIDRTQPGFEDFCRAGRAAIAPGNPALSLLYHALASPDVYPSPTGPRTDEDFPTLAELDVVENYIYSLARRELTDFTNAVIAVFAYQYRAGTRSVHRLHADMAYSRTGIARVGTAPMHYDPLRRSFWVAPADGAPGLCVMPARYGAFIAERRKLTKKDAVMHPLDDGPPRDGQRTFLVPAHKLFPGNECLVGENIGEMSFLEYHHSEKLRRIHTLAPAKGGVPPLPGFDISAPPFVRESGELVKLQPAGASILLVPIPRPTLAATARQHNSVSGKDEIVRFRVPPEDSELGGRGNRFADSSFQIPASGNLRAAPEYAHIRLHVRPSGQLFDLNVLSPADFFKVLKTARFQNVAGVENGPLEAAHLVDNTCDGAISVHIALSRPLKAFAAVSFVVAPDFLPLVDQMEVQRWAERHDIAKDDVYFAQGGPSPLCYGRDIAPNPALVDPLTHTDAAFDRGEAANRAFAAILGGAPQSSGRPLPLKVSVSTSWLPDAAANVFEPGWDAAISGDGKGEFYANYGLGSPFPEDAKLCAALNAFWPAAAPDVGRTFGGMTAVPLLDEELGFHPRHPRVLAGQAVSTPGWDGEFGPFFTANGKKVNFAALERSDYTTRALQGKLGIGLLGRIDAVEQLARMDVFRECADRIRGNTAMKDFAILLVTAEKVADWSQRPDRFQKTLTGPGYLYVFADIGDSDDAEEDQSDPTRRVADVQALYTFQVTAKRVGRREGDGPPEVTLRRHS